MVQCEKWVCLVMVNCIWAEEMNLSFGAVLEMDRVCEKLYQIYISKMTVFDDL